MAFSYNVYTGDGTTTQFAVPFGYVRREHVLATVAGSPATFTWINDSLIQMDVVPANGATVRVYRQTPLTNPLVDFTDGSTLVAADLDTNARQSIYTQQELDDSLADGLAGVIPNGDKGDITTSANGSVWTIDNGAVTSAKIANDTIVDADINSAAAITGTKIQQGSTSDRGTVQLTDSVSSTSTTTAATPNSVKTTYDAALLKTGGTMTGPITFASNQTFLSDYQEFTSNGTWTKPANCTMVYVELVGGGAGGGSGATNPTANARGGGSGGAGGAGLYKLFNASSLTATVSVTIGAGGVGAAGVSLFNAAGDNGNSGGNTQFGSYLESGAAGGGLGGIDVAVAGGSVSFKASTYINASVGGAGLLGNGGAGFFIAFPVGGAGGGGGAGRTAGNTTSAVGGAGGYNAFLRSTSATISAGQNAPINEGGGGGGGSYVTATNGMNAGNGAFPGGGGGGGAACDDGFTSGAGGNGAAGIVRVWSW